MNIKFKRTVELLLVLILSGTVQTLFSQIKSWNHTLYTTKDGLSSNVIHNVTQDHDGFLWISTESGLCRFDGDEFVKVLHDDKDTTSLPSECVNYVSVTPNGQILASTLKGLFVMNPKTMKGYTIHCSIQKGWEWLDDKFMDISVNYAIQKVIVLSATAFHYYEFDMTPYATIAYPFSDHDVNKHSDISHHPPIFSKNGDVIFWDNETQEFSIVDYRQKKIVPLKEAQQNNYNVLASISNIEAFGSDIAANVWFYKATHDTLFCFMANEQNINYYPISEGLARQLSWIGRMTFPDKHHMLWAYSHSSHVSIYELPYDELIQHNGQHITIANSSGFSAAIYTEFTDKDNNWWLASMNGLYFLKKEFRSFEKIEIPVPYHGESDWQHVTDIKPIDSTSLFITTMAERCYLYNRQQNSMISYLDTIPMERAWKYWMDVIIPLPKHRWLVRGARDLVWENNKLSFGLKPLNEFEKIIREKANYGYYEDIHRNIWMSFQQKGLGKFNPTTSSYKLYPPRDGFVSTNFSAIDGDRSGNVYFASYVNRGIWKYNIQTDTFEHIFTYQKALPLTNWINILVVGDSDKLYFSNYQGIVILNLKNNTTKLIGMKDGLPSNVIKGLFYYKHNLFVATKNGLAIINTTDLSLQVLNQRNGIVEDITTQAFYIDSVRNTLFIGGKAALYKIDLLSLLKKENDIHVVLNAAYVNGELMNFTNTKLILKHNENNITFSVSSIDFYSCANKSYSYRIILNGDTLPWRSNNRSKQFALLNMAPGAYRIEVKSKNANNQWSLNTAYLSFEIMKPWYNRWWFYILCVLAIMLTLYLIYLYRLKQIRSVDRIRNKLSRDLHDDIGSTLSSINILSRTAQRNAQLSGDEKTTSSLEKINERSQRLLTNMSDIIWNINPGNDTVDEMMSRMREYATTILEAKQIEYTFNFHTEKINKLPMEMKNNLYLIFKEAVNNLSKYSGCTTAVLTLNFTERNIHLIIEDNGSGFNMNEIKHRGGLLNMQHRADEMKGKLSIHSTIGVGTKIDLIV